MQRGKDDKLLFTVLKLFVTITMKPGTEADQATKQRIVECMRAHKKVRT